MYLKDQVLLFFVVVFSALLLQTVLLQPIATAGYIQHPSKFHLDMGPKKNLPDLFVVEKHLVDLPPPFSTTH